MSHLAAMAGKGKAQQTAAENKLVKKEQLAKKKPVSKKQRQAQRANKQREYESQRVRCSRPRVHAGLPIVNFVTEHTQSFV